MKQNVQQEAENMQDLSSYDPVSLYQFINISQFHYNFKPQS